MGTILITDERANQLGSRGIPSLADLAVQLQRLHARLAEHGRDPSTLDLCVPGGEIVSALAQPEKHLRQLERMREIGATMY